jgi:tetraprenyl-beta-curcumene synthase
VEATAVFATLAPARRRATAVRAMVSLQVAIDYLDTLGEEDCEEPLRNGLQLHRALEAAVTPGAAAEDWYRFHPRREEGAYLARLVAACQQSLGALPAREAVLPALRGAARRCGEGQSHTHAGDSLAAWAGGLEAPGVYRWWEVAAGASSSVAAHALLGAAAAAGTGAEDAAAIDRAYHPPIGALTVLLDDLIDREEDAASGAHNYMAYYRDPDEAASRLELIARLGEVALAPLPRHRRHRAILLGVVGFYLSDPGAESSYAQPIRERLLAAAGAAVRPIVASRRRRG